MTQQEGDQKRQQGEWRHGQEQCLIAPPEPRDKPAEGNAPSQKLDIHGAVRPVNPSSIKVAINSNVWVVKASTVSTRAARLSHSFRARMPPRRPPSQGRTGEWPEPATVQARSCSNSMICGCSSMGNSSLSKDSHVCRSRRCRASDRGESTMLRKRVVFCLVS